MRSQLYPCTKNSTRFLFRDCISVRGVLQYKSHEFSSGKLRYSAMYRQIILSGTLPLFRLDASKWLLRIFIAISFPGAVKENACTELISVEFPYKPKTLPVKRREAFFVIGGLPQTAQDLRCAVRIVCNQRIRADTGEIFHIFFRIHGPVLDGQIVGMGEVDDRRGTKIDAEARLGVAEWQLEHVIGAGEALFADQSGEVELCTTSSGLALRWASG